MDDEALQLTQQLLSSNPDFATLWNYRREILMHMETVKLVISIFSLFSQNGVYVGLQYEHYASPIARLCFLQERGRDAEGL